MEETMAEEIKAKIETPNNQTAVAINMGLSEILHTQFFSYKGKNYKVIKLVKTRVSTGWEIGVEYQALYDVGPLDWEGSFVQTVAEFLLKFSPTPKEG